jgi:hypothetical protein
MHYKLFKWHNSKYKANIHDFWMISTKLIINNNNHKKQIYITIDS